MTVLQTTVASYLANPGQFESAAEEARQMIVKDARYKSFVLLDKTNEASYPVEMDLFKKYTTRVATKIWKKKVKIDHAGFVNFLSIAMGGLIMSLFGKISSNDHYLARVAYYKEKYQIDTHVGLYILMMKIQLNIPVVWAAGEYVAYNSFGEKIELYAKTKESQEVTKKVKEDGHQAFVDGLIKELSDKFNVGKGL